MKTKEKIKKMIRTYHEVYSIFEKQLQEHKDHLMKFQNIYDGVVDIEDSVIDYLDNSSRQIESFENKINKFEDEVVESIIDEIKSGGKE